MKIEMTNKEALDRLNAALPGWTTNGVMLTNPIPDGGIIDKTIATDEWFVCFNDLSVNNIFFDQLEDAVNYFLLYVKNNV